jgi:glycosyltransferase involved in cell wall biosynthesis
LELGPSLFARRVGGLVDAIEDGVSGLVVSAGDVARLRDVVAGLLADPGRASALGEVARARVADTSSAAGSASAALAAYEGALADRTARTSQR